MCDRWLPNTLNRNSSGRFELFTPQEPVCDGAVMWTGVCNVEFRVYGLLWYVWSGRRQSDTTIFLTRIQVRHLGILVFSWPGR